jgi:hypothetical protein
VKDENDDGYRTIKSMETRVRLEFSTHWVSRFGKIARFDRSLVGGARRDHEWDA